MVLRFTALSPADRMGVIEPDQSLTLRPVHRERVVDAVRLLRRHRHPRHHEPDPMTALWVHHEHLPVGVGSRGSITAIGYYPEATQTSESDPPEPRWRTAVGALNSLKKMP